MRRVRFTLALPMIAAALLVGCGDGADTPLRSASGDRTGLDPESIPHEGEALKAVTWDGLFPPGDEWKQYPQELVFNNGAEPETLDPHLMTGVPEHRIAMALFEGLTIHHPRTLQAMPGVAEWWEISDDGVVYTFHLRPDAKWSNGDPLTAEDFRWSWERAISPATASKYAYQLYSVKNARAYAEGTLKDISQVGMEVVDDHTFRVTLEAPTAYFLELTSFETLMPAHRGVIEEHGIRWTRPENFVCNGPFTVSEWRPRDAIVMVPNERYWNHSMVRLTKIVAKPFDDLNTAYNEYMNGRMDWLPDVPQKRIDEVMRDPDYYAWPWLGSYFYRFNVTRPPFDDYRIRLALNLAIDKESLCIDTLKSGEMPATGHVPAAMGDYIDYPEFQGFGYDPSRAKELLAEAGFPGGEGFPDLELTYNTSERHKQVAEVLSSMWRETLGINVKLRNMEWKVYLDQVTNMNYQFVRAGWIGDYVDPVNFLDMFVTDGGNNNTGWSNEEYDRLIADSAKEPDAEKRFAMLQRAEEILCKEHLPILPLFYYVKQGVKRPRLRGIQENIRALHPFNFMWMDGPAPQGR